MVATTVTVDGGTADAPIRRLVTESEAGSTDERREYHPDGVRLLEQHQGTAGISQGGELAPPPTLLFADSEVGDRWTANWTSDGTQATADFHATGTDTHQIGGSTWDCLEITATITYRGDVDAVENQVTCWIPELGMAARQQRDLEGRSNGVEFEAHTNAALESMPT